MTDVGNSRLIPRMHADVAHPEILNFGGWIMGIMFCLLGLLSVAASIMGWKWFFGTVSARMITGTTGLKVARILYGVLGAGIMAMGIFITVYLCRQ